MRALTFVAVLAALAVPAGAENLTAVSKKMLADAKLAESAMDGLDKELAISPEIVAAAKKEGKLRVQMQMSEQEFNAVNKVFAARYPGIDIEYIRGIGAQTMKVLVAYKTGTITADVVAAYDSRADEYRSVGLFDLRDLPAYPSLREEMKTPDGTDAADKMNYWCMTYSPERMKKADLPKTWDEALIAPALRNGRLGIASNTGQTLVPTLFVKLGDAWGDNWLNKLFGEVKPQLRKETLAAISKLIAVGEFDAAFAVQDYVTERDNKRGMPVAAHCPEPVVGTWGKLGILKGSPYPNAAKLYVNWHISKEGQIANYIFARQVPVHAGLWGRDFLPYPDEVMGKKLLFRTDEVFPEQGRIMAKWSQLWQSAGGANIE